MQSNAATAAEYLAGLPADRRAAIEAVRQAILANLPAGYEEAMNYGMITYQVPLARYPDTYNGRPLAYAALASQKNYMAVYLMAIYGDDEARQRFETAYRATGKRYDVGKSCVRFKKLDDLPLALIGECIALLGVDQFVARVEKVHPPRARPVTPANASAFDQVFIAEVKKEGSFVFVAIPFSPREAWGARPRYPVSGTINDIAVRGTLGALGKDYFLRLRTAWLRDSGIAPGATVSVKLSLAV
jgi:hypothetical protein